MKKEGSPAPVERLVEADFRWVSNMLSSEQQAVNPLIWFWFPHAGIQDQLNQSMLCSSDTERWIPACVAAHHEPPASACRTSFCLGLPVCGCVCTVCGQVSKQDA